MTTAARTVDDIAEVIREIDGDNDLPAVQLGKKLSETLYRRSLIGVNRMGAVVAFVISTNPDKALTPDRLAELIVAEFDLDKE